MCACKCSHLNVLMQIVFKTRIYHCNINSQVRASLVPGPEEEEEEKGPRFSCSRIHLIVMEFHCLCILLIYFWTLVMPVFILSVTLSVDLS